MKTSQVRVLYSFPQKIGAGRICWTAWQQVLGAHRAGTAMIALVGGAARVFPAGITVRYTLGYRSVKLPYRLLGPRYTSQLHDWRVARWLQRHASEVDVVHGWPLGALRTIRAARRAGIPVVLERPNAHTAFAYAAAEEECRRVGVILPRGFEHKFDAARLSLEESEYAEADYLLCPSGFVAHTFVDRGIPAHKLLRHQYGFDAVQIKGGNQDREVNRGLVVLYAGLCTPRKGLHFALEAWHQSGLSTTGTFLICGEFVPGYRDCLGALLEHPSIQVLGHRTDLPNLMRTADVFVLSSVEEGSALVTYEARGSGCVLAVSDASGAVCEHGVDGLVHKARHVDELAAHLRELDRSRSMLAKLREASISGLDQLTWTAAGVRLAGIYRHVSEQARTRESRSELPQKCLQ